MRFKTKELKYFKNIAFPEKKLNSKFEEKKADLNKALFLPGHMTAQIYWNTSELREGRPLPHKS